MNRKQWLSKPGNSAETTLALTKETRVLITDLSNRTGEGWGANEEAAFKEAHADYKAKNHRADLTTRHAKGRAVKPV